ncbi:Arm DNA-binding domain-containing protein [Bacillus sp. FJAT-18017]|uniref:Arm DNA-binding domain-containing protein n=1 Tax=Bacillus sp. FJAT-18017 TaxID=1705566 RepID=UPI003FA44888
MSKKDKNGTYYFVLENGRDTNGKRSRIKRRGFKKISEAKAAMAELTLDYKRVPFSRKTRCH